MAGLKEYETRGWETSYRGLVSIHASRAFGYEAQSLCDQEPFKTALKKAGISRVDMPRGVLLGTIELFEVIPTARMNTTELSPEERAFGDFRLGRYAWRFRKPQLTPVSFPRISRTWATVIPSWIRSKFA
jgi:activating signal cointegrator 1